MLFWGCPSHPKSGRAAIASRPLNANSGSAVPPTSRRTGSSTCRVSTQQHLLSLTAMASSRCETFRRIFPSLPDSSGLWMPSVSGQEYISDDLGDALAPLGPPAAYLDFETFSPAVPLYAGTSPYQRIPFQWSIHHDDGVGDVRHFEFLANGDVDPRREFAETLLQAIDRASGPIIVYSPFEASVLRRSRGIFARSVSSHCSR